MGLTESEPCQATGEFIDWFGKPFAQQVLPVGALRPGASVEMTFFSMVRKDEANQQKGDKYTLRVKFSGQKGPARRLDVYRRYREEVPGLVPLPGRSAGPEMLLWPD